MEERGKRKFVQAPGRGSFWAENLAVKETTWTKVDRSIRPPGQSRQVDLTAPKPEQTVSDFDKIPLVSSELDLLPASQRTFPLCNLFYSQYPFVRSALGLGPS